MKTFAYLFRVIGFLVTGFSASAMTLKEQKEMREWNSYLTDPNKSYMSEAKTKCGYDIPVTFDSKMISPFMEINANGAAYCDLARHAVANLCDDPDAKGMVKKNIKKIECNLGKKDEVTIGLKAGVLSMLIGVEGSNIDDKVKAYLENNLK